jgi:hypothetical protein
MEWDGKIDQLKAQDKPGTPTGMLPVLGRLLRHS